MQLVCGRGLLLQWRGHTHKRTYMHTRTSMYTHAHVQTHTHARTHTRTHTHTHTTECPVPNSRRQARFKLVTLLPTPAPPAQHLPARVQTSSLRVRSDLGKQSFSAERTSHQSLLKLNLFFCLVMDLSAIHEMKLCQ